ncbi:unnamed protein product [Vitrella brassicaformis CCMP3155]|uniref:Uncharacterized protein n=1 Tax=Vitrella brassicaformis (strain CCMP3155) TaxID=1169540 RepID=A0A0G4ENX9_VITBC|nr:unnamed protein product [Vitrella brassicaformis CCMP3155]|eukprot:CEL99124.1 unnamed protein product [Vitrella brassicaformis CCMP3155]
MLAVIMLISGGLVFMSLTHEGRIQHMGGQLSRHEAAISQLEQSLMQMRHDHNATKTGLADVLRRTFQELQTTKNEVRASRTAQQEDKAAIEGMLMQMAQNSTGQDKRIRYLAESLLDLTRAHELTRLWALRAGGATESLMDDVAALRENVSDLEAMQEQLQLLKEKVDSWWPGFWEALFGGVEMIRLAKWLSCFFAGGGWSICTML